MIFTLDLDSLSCGLRFGCRKEAMQAMVSEETSTVPRIYFWSAHKRRFKLAYPIGEARFGRSCCKRSGRRSFCTGNVMMCGHIDHA